MGEIKNFYWLVPLVGGVISLVGFLFPAWYSPPVWVEYVWIIGIIHHVTGGNMFETAPSEMFIPSIIATVLIFLSSAMIILIALLKFKRKTAFGNAENYWITLVILEIGASIFYIFGIHNGFFQLTDLNFGDIYEIQFGLLVPFIGASLTLTGAIIGKFINRDLNKILIK